MIDWLIDWLKFIVSIACTRGIVIVAIIFGVLCRFCYQYIFSVTCCELHELEYLDYLTTIDMPSAFWQLSVSSQHMVKSLTLTTYMSLFNLKLCTHIWSTNINFRPPPLTLDFMVRLGLNFHPMSEFRGVDWASDTFLSRTETWLLKSRLAACERRD